MMSDVKEVVDLPPALAEKPAGLPPGKYALIGWDMDTTGRKFIHEICQIAAYFPKEKYSQYIMPYGELNPSARRRNYMRIVTVGRYRMLKDTRTHKVLKTKSEISALTDFMSWLENEMGDRKVILIYHEPRRLYPIMLLEALNRYNLLDRFKSIVAGFMDGYALAADKCTPNLKSVALRVLAERVLLDDEWGKALTALDRANAAYRVFEQLSKLIGSGGAGVEGTIATDEMLELARIWTRPVHTELEARDNVIALLKRQNTYRPVFGPLLRSSRPERKHFIYLRRLLADAGFVFELLKDAWKQNQRAGLENLLSPLLDSTREENVNELIEIFDCFFDPTKKPKGPITKMSPATAHGGGIFNLAESDSSSDSRGSSHHNTPNKSSRDAAGTFDSAGAC